MGEYERYKTPPPITMPRRDIPNGWAERGIESPSTSFRIEGIEASHAPRNNDYLVLRWSRFRAIALAGDDCCERSMFDCRAW